MEETIRTIGKILGIVSATLGLIDGNVSAVLFGAFIFFANTKIGD